MSINNKPIVEGDSLSEINGPRPISKNNKEIEDGLRRVTVCENSYSDDIGHILFIILVVICIVIDLTHT